MEDLRQNMGASHISSPPPSPSSLSSTTTTDYSTTSCSDSSAGAMCVLCNFEVSNLKRLPCCHLACVSCLLKSWMHTEKVADKLRCPICQLEFSVSADADPQWPRFEHVADQSLRSLEEARSPHFECCSACSKSQLEMDLLVCANCVKEQHGIDLACGQYPSGDFSLKPLCGICAVRAHIRFGHMVVDYFPLKSSRQYQRYFEKQMQLKGMFDETCRTLKAEMLKLDGMLMKTNRNLSILTDITRSASSSEQQYSFNLEFELFTERMTRILSEMAAGMKDSVEDFEIENSSLQKSAASVMGKLHHWNSEQLLSK